MRIAKNHTPSPEMEKPKLIKPGENRLVSAKTYQRDRESGSALTVSNSNLNHVSPIGDETRRLTRLESRQINGPNAFTYDSSEEIDILHNTIEDLQKKLKEKNGKFKDLFLKYTSLETNKIKMENDLRSRIMSLEEQLTVTKDTLTEFRDETEADIEETLSSALDTQEALFLQERLRCTKLMYEKVCLHHEIQRLQDLIRRQRTVSKDQKDPKRSRLNKSAVDKATSEPLMSRF